MTSGLRTLLRMDPDVVLVGEIRDTETADIAMRTASSGKYVFTTLHTRDVASTITAVPRSAHRQPLSRRQPDRHRLAALVHVCAPIAGDRPR